MERYTLCSRIGRINTVKMPTLPKAVCRFSAAPVSMPTALFTELEQTILKCIWNKKKKGKRKK